MKIETIKFLSDDDPLEPQAYRCSSRCTNSFGSCNHVQDVRVDVKNRTFIAEARSKYRVVIKDQSSGYYGLAYEFSRKSRYDEWRCRLIDTSYSKEDDNKNYFFPEIIYRLSMSMNKIVNMAYEKEKEN